jgi:peptide/nickel transport system substrate-binding protein
VLLLDLVHSRLTFVDADAERLVPGLAVSWQKNADATAWSFQLGSGRTADGDEVTAEDVVFSAGLYLDERFRSSQRANFIIGGRPIEVSAADPKTVTVRAAAPAPFLDWLLAGMTVLPKRLYGPLAGDPVEFKKALGEKADPSVVRGFGPFSLSRRTPRQLELVRNPNFGRDAEGPLPRLGRITVSLIKDPTTQKLRFLEDDRFPWRTPDPVEAEEYRTRPGFTVHDLGVGNWTVQFWLNQNLTTPLPPAKAALFKNVKFRRAIGHAINRQEVIDRACGGAAAPLFGTI